MSYTIHHADCLDAMADMICPGRVCDLKGPALHEELIA